MENLSERVLLPELGIRIKDLTPALITIVSVGTGPKKPDSIAFFQYRTGFSILNCSYPYR